MNTVLQIAILALAFCMGGSVGSFLEERDSIKLPNIENSFCDKKTQKIEIFYFRSSDTTKEDEKRFRCVPK